LNDATDEDLPAGRRRLPAKYLSSFPRPARSCADGDTALIRGMAAAAKQIAPQVKIIGVQAERAPSYYLSMERGQSGGTETCDTIADGLRRERRKRRMCGMS